MLEIVLYWTVCLVKESSHCPAFSECLDRTYVRLRFLFHVSFLLFFFFFQAATFDYYPVNSAFVHYSQVPQTSLFSHFFIKNWSYDTIHAFKIILLQYFQFLVFSKNKLYPNRPLVVLL